MAEVEVMLLRVPAPEAGDRLHVTPLFAGSPLAPPVSPAVPPARTCTLAAETETVMFGGGGGGVLLPLQPAVKAAKSKLASNTQEIIFPMTISPDSARQRTACLLTLYWIWMGPTWPYNG